MQSLTRIVGSVMLAGTIAASERELLSKRDGAASELNFLVMGDWGGTGKSPYTTSAEVNTAKAMNSAAEKYGAKFTLALGDNFYSHGVKSVTDSRFKKTFENCFSGEHLSSDSGFTFHVLAGNHDHLGNAQAQIDYTSHSKRWSFPSFYYSFTKTAPDGAVVEFVMIDTVTIAGNSELEGRSLTGSELPGPSNVSAAGAQMTWVKKTLEASTADYLIVAGHYPVYSIMEHGPTNALSPKKFPHMRNNKVSAYLCGHDHGEQYIDVGDGIQYHVIGSAHGGDSSTAHKNTLSKGQLKFHSASNGGFATVSVSKTGMQIKHMDASGKVLYTAPVISPRRPPAPTPPPVPTPPPAPGNCTAVSGVVLGTGSLEKIQDVASHGDCCDLCSGNEKCVAYTHKTKENECFLKDNTDPSGSKSDRVSGIVVRPPQPPSPPSPPSPSPAPADPFCERGIAEHNPTQAGDACCPMSCGRCGGSGCSNLPGGKQMCCAGIVHTAGLSCDTHDAPCVVNGLDQRLRASTFSSERLV